MSRSRCALRVAPLCWLLFACTDGDEGDPGACGAAPCPEVCAHVVEGYCDVRETACLQRLLDAVSCVRGTPGVLPETRILTSEEYRLELEAEAEAGTDAGTDDAGTDDAGTDDAGVPYEPPSSAALRLLGLIEPMRTFEDYVDEQVAYKAGFYESDRQRVTVIDSGNALDDYGAVSVMAHELVHALQDQTVGLAELPEPEWFEADAWFARSCLVEGDADLYSGLAMGLLSGLARERVDWENVLKQRLKYAQRTVLRAASPHTALWLLRYPVGTRYLLDAHSHGGNWEVQRLFEAPPTSSIQWLVGYDANTTRTAHLVEPLACDAPHKPEGYEDGAVLKLGAAELYAFLGHHLRDGGRVELEAQWLNALHWRQDELSVFVGPTSEVALSYRIRFGDPELAERLATRLRDVLPSALRVRRNATELEVIGAEDEAVLEAWPGGDGACAAAR